MSRRIAAIVISLLAAFFAPRAEAGAISDGSTFPAKDTLNCQPDANADANDCIAGLQWKTGTFDVRCEPAKQGNGDWLVRFPSPVPSGDAVNDSVSMEWHMARDRDGNPAKAPAVVIVHESGRGMVAGRIFAKGLRPYGLHTFLVHLPGYGERTSTLTNNPKLMLPALKQAIADVRRARDAVAALPFVDSGNIGLQGTSLGGFVTATLAGLDRGYDHVFILLAGGNISEVILTGARDAAGLKKRLLQSGITDDDIRAGAKVIEPMRLAHRVDPKRVWLYTGKNDEVVPPACSRAFAKAANLDKDHHVELPVGHYTAAVLMPLILPKINELMRATPAP